jgi:hypothetical protein
LIDRFVVGFEPVMIEWQASGEAFGQPTAGQFFLDESANDGVGPARWSRAILAAQTGALTRAMSAIADVVFRGLIAAQFSRDRGGGASELFGDFPLRASFL